jgi:hypothetical protein
MHLIFSYIQNKYSSNLQLTKSLLRDFQKFRISIDLFVLEQHINHFLGTRKIKHLSFCERLDEKEREREREY